MVGEPWESTNQRIQELRKLGYPPWTMRYAFMVDVGWFLLGIPVAQLLPADGG